MATDAGREPIWLEVNVVLAVHDRQIAEHGGATGMRDLGLLQSALARPRHAAAYGVTDLCALAALHAAGIARNHPFVDGNKRTAFLVACVFLDCNGLEVVASENDALDQMLALAAGKIGDDRFADWLRGVVRALPTPAR